MKPLMLSKRAKNLYKRSQIKNTIDIAHNQEKRAEFWFKYGVHDDVERYIESKGGIVRVGLGE